MKVKFIQDAIILADGLPQKMFDSGAEVDLNDASAERWTRRGIAVFLDGAPDASAGTIITPPSAAASEVPTAETEAAAAASEGGASDEQADAAPRGKKGNGKKGNG